ATQAPHRARPGGVRVSAQEPACPEACPHRARPGRATVSAQEGRLIAFFPPTGLAPVERRVLHLCGRAPKHPLCPRRRCTGASPVGASVRASLRLCRNRRSTGLAPVGAAGGRLSPPSPSWERTGAGRRKQGTPTRASCMFLLFYMVCIGV